VQNHANLAEKSDSLFAAADTLPTIKQATQSLIDEALQRSNNNQRMAALMLGISPQALSQRLKRK
jgi:DNA-binding protein Fis